MNGQNASPELERLKQELTGELQALRSEVERLEKQVQAMSQAQRTDQPASVQEQMAREIQARPQNPDQNIEQYSGR